MVLSNRTTLFCGIDDPAKMIEKLGCREESFQKDSIIVHKGDIIRSFAMVLDGSASVLRYDIEGNGNLVSVIDEGEIFAEAFGVEGSPSPVTIVARENATVLWFPLDKVLEERTLVCNLLIVSAERNLFLTKRLEHLSKRSLRDKVLSFLEEMREKNGSDEFDIELDRQEMADYLASDRSALSLVLSKLRKEGMLDFRKNHFVLKFTPKA